MSGELSVLRLTPHQRIAELWAFFLTREGLTVQIEPRGDQWALLAHVLDAERAEQFLAEIDAEPLDEDDLPRTVVPFPPQPWVDWGRSWTGAVAAWIVMAFYFATGPAAPPGVWYERGANGASTLHEPFRVVTALTLHADFLHVLSNAAALFVFLTFAAMRLGPGLSLSLVVAASAFANLLSRLAQGPNVSSVGASTAVFAVLGVLAATTLMDPTRRRRAWVIVAAGLALLGFFGASPGTDVIAHLFGFACGLGLAIPVVARLRQPPAVRTQAILAVATVALFPLAWLVQRISG